MKVSVIAYFEGMLKSHPPVIQTVVLEDVRNLLEGNPGTYLEAQPELFGHFREICDNFEVQLPPIKRS